MCSSLDVNCLCGSSTAGVKVASFFFKVCIMCGNPEKFPETKLMPACTNNNLAPKIIGPHTAEQHVQGELYLCGIKGRYKL